MPAHRKPPGTHQGHRRHSAAVVLAMPGNQGPPDPPARLSKATLGAGEGFWASPLSTMITTADHPALRRLFELLDERDRLWRGYRRERLVEGSQHQPVLNPLFRAAMVLEVEIRALEDRFGLTPAARLRLGIQLGQAARSLEDLAGGLDDDDLVGAAIPLRAEEPDPRLPPA